MEKDLNYYQNLDKRTKEYKEWVKRSQESSKGLGDIVESITEATGIKKVVKAIWGEDCGCEERKEKLNRLFRRTNVKCLEEDEYLYLKDFYSRNKGSKVDRADVRMLVRIHNRVMGSGYKESTSCSTCVRTCYTNLNKVYNDYNN